MKHRLIITADDYGLCDSVNRAIDACAEAKVVLSTNVMPNMDKAEDAADLKKRFPYLSIGIHYNFTVGKPISPADQVQTLIHPDGTFLSYPEIRKKCREGTYNFKEVAQEMKLQYNRYREICGEPDYWNTHENVHVYPKLYQFFRDEALGVGIKKMRSHQRIFIPSSNGKKDRSLLWLLAEPFKEVMLNSWQKQSAKLGVISPDGVLVRMKEDDKLNLSYLFSHIKWKSTCIAELTIHPSINGNNKYFGAITDLRVKEYLCFSSHNVLDIANKNRIEIVGFDAVGEE